MLRLFSLMIVSVVIYGNERPFATCRISGQLGNNLNQIATTLSYAWDHDIDCYFPELNKCEWNISYNRDKFFFRINHDQPPRPCQHVYDEYENGKGWWDCNRVTYKPDQYLSGDFFCWKHFHHHRNKFLELFAPSQEVLLYLHNKYEFLLNHPKTVAVHVRTYNKAYHESVIRFLGLEYFNNAIKKFPEDYVFVIFSDRVNWCKQKFPKINRQFVFIEGNNQVEDFHLMSMLKNHIISNSCYSWWATYLSKSPNKVVIAPNRNGVFHFYVNENIYFPDWILIDPNLNESYPTDMLDFDTYSQSVDTQ